VGTGAAPESAVISVPVCVSVGLLCPCIYGVDREGICVNSLTFVIQTGLSCRGWFPTCTADRYPCLHWLTSELKSGLLPDSLHIGGVSFTASFAACVAVCVPVGILLRSGATPESFLNSELDELT
jgi:hypothetical protein